MCYIFSRNFYFCSGLFFVFREVLFWYCSKKLLFIHARILRYGNSVVTVEIGKKPGFLSWIEDPLSS